MSASSHVPQNMGTALVIPFAIIAPFVGAAILVADKNIQLRGRN